VSGSNDVYTWKTEPLLQEMRERMQIGYATKAATVAAAVVCGWAVESSMPSVLVYTD